MLTERVALRFPVIIKMMEFIFLMSTAAWGQENTEVPKLLSGDTPQRILREKNLGRPSGYVVFDFLVKAEGTVDSIHILSHYYYNEEGDRINRLNERDYNTIKGFRFQHQGNFITIDNIKTG
ncbi:MAG: hypothetical protein KF870_04865 [Leadbetterella sp.]|nr:hypothetical protein [Leadbetterella sp.]